MRPLTPILCSLLLANPLVHAAPSSPEITNTPEGDTLSSWRRLSDAVWKRIWRTPDVETPVPVTPETPYRRPSGTLLAKYGGDLVLRFNISTADEAKALSDAANVMFLDVWEFNDDWMDIRLAKDVVPSLLGLLPDSLQTAHTPLMQDLDLVQAICNSYPSSGSTRSHHDDNGAFTPRLRTSSSTSPSSSDNIFFSDYQPYSVILPWMNLMASMFPTHVRRISIGRTHEGRDIPGLRVGAHPTNDERDDGPRPTILVTGGAHAREWISTSTVNYVAWSLITTYGKSLAVTQMLQAFDWVFVPTLNPDGYVHTWDADRLWRKNRQPTPLRFCRGLDVDRSFPFHWDGDGEAGAPHNSNPCSESYPGTAPLEAHEAASFVRWALNETGTTTTSASRRTDFVAYLDLHSYSEQVLYPYAYSCAAEPPTLEDLEELAFGLAKAMRVTPGGHGYKVGSACEGNVGARKAKPEPKPQPESFRGAGAGAGAGSALDWVYHALRVKYAYQLKLRDTGNYGFLLPKEEIVPTGQEVLEAVVYLGRFLMGEVGLSGGGEGVGLTEGGEGEVGGGLGKGGEVGDNGEGEGEFWDLRRR